MENKKINEYRKREQVVKDCVESGAMTAQEGAIMQRTINRADRYFNSGKMFINLKPFEAILDDKFKKKLEKGELSEKQLNLLHLVRVASVHKPNIQVITEVEESCKNYFEIMLQDDKSPTFAGLSLALGISIKDLKAIASGVIKTPAQQVIVSYISMLQADNEQAIRRSGGVGEMFLGKNHYNLNDKLEVEHTEKKQEMTDEELEEKYNNLEVVEVIDPDDYQE